MTTFEVIVGILKIFKMEYVFQNDAKVHFYNLLPKET